MLRRLMGLAALANASIVFGQTNATGVNVDFLRDSANTPLLADVMRTYRDANAIGSAYNANDLTLNGGLDTNGWPTQDAWFFLGDPAFLQHGDGTYAVKFTGSATVAVGNKNNVSYVTQQYDASTNTTTATIKMPTGIDLTQLYFTNTKRDSNATLNTGITDIQVMRPQTPSGNDPYAFGTTFTQQTKDIAGKVSVLRFMDYLATNSNTQTTWTDRVTPKQVQLNPAVAGNSRGKGGPLELAVQLGNETNKDIWINIPAGANDDYVKNVANLIKYGSDGTNPYTSVQANPVYKPLDPNLKVYLEYSNETWNTGKGFQQSTQIKNLAAAEVAGYAGGVGPLNYDGATDSVQLAMRYHAQRTKQIADIFAGVYGDGALLNTVRPILAWQKGNGSDGANQASKILEGYYGNQKGNFVAAPKAINSYIFGGGGDAYYYPPFDANTNVDSIINGIDTSTNGNWTKNMKDVAYATTFGIKRVAYEGGLSLATSTTTPELDAIKAAAGADPRLRQLVVKNHNTWSNQGGDLLVYYYASDEKGFGISDSAFSTETERLKALSDLKGAASSKDWTFGTPLRRWQKTVIDGGQWTLNEKLNGAHAGAGTISGPGGWVSYLINIPTTGDYTLDMSYKLYGTGGFSLLLGGAEIYSVDGVAASPNKYGAIPQLLLTLPSGVTSLRVLLNNHSGDLSLQNLTFTPFPVLEPIPEPASLAILGLGAVALLKRRRRVC